MIELKDKRTYTAKHFQKEDGKFVMHAHSGHIFYNNKLGVGDGKKGLRGIDWTLQWDEKRRGWYFQFHNFHPFLPEYSDEWVEFRDLYEDKDQTIRYKAICNHVKGRLVKAEELEKEGLKDLTGVNCVIYDDAFGKGFDYILYFTRSTLVKAARIRDGYKPKSDVSFEWQVDFPKDPETLSPLPIFRTERKEDLTDELKTLEETQIKEKEKTKAYLLDYASPKEFDTRKQTLIGQDKLDGKEWFTYFRPFRVWDSNEDELLQEIVKTEIYPKDGKFFLRKIVTADFLAKSVGDIFTDTTTSYYAGAGDGYVFFQCPNGQSDGWNYVREAVGTESGNWIVGDDKTGGDISIRSSYKSSYDNYKISRVFFPFDTSALPDTATIDSASLYFYCGHGFHQSGDYLALVQTFQASVTSLSNSDFDDCGDALDNPTEGASRITYSGTETDIWKQFTLNSTGLGWISKTGYTKLGIRCYRDIEDVVPSNYSRWSISYSESDNDPYLEITYTEGATNTTITPDAISLTISQQTITVTAKQNITVSTNTQDLQLSAEPPTIDITPSTTNVTVTPDENNLAITAPLVSTDVEQAVTISAAAQTVTIINNAVVVNTGRTIAVETQAITITQPAVTVTTGGNITITPDILSLNVSQPTISVSSTANVSTASQSVTINLNAVTVSTSYDVNITPAALDLTVSNPLISTDVEQNISYAANAQTVTVNILTPTVTARTPVTIAAAALDLTVSQLALSVSTIAQVNYEAEALSVTVGMPDITISIAEPEFILEYIKPKVMEVKSTKPQIQYLDNIKPKILK